MLINNLWDTATVTVSVGSVIPTLPIANTQRKGRAYTAAIVPNISNTTVIDFTLPNFALASGLVLNRHWLSNASEVRFELFNEDDQTGEQVIDTGFVQAVQLKTLAEMNWFVDPLVASPFDTWPHKFTNIWFERTFFKSGRITIVDANARDGLHEIDRIFLGDVFQPKVNFSYGNDFSYQSTETQKQAVSGSFFGTQREKYREQEFTLAWVSESERPRLADALRDAGTSLDWFVSLYPEAGGQKEIEYAMACTFKVPPTVNHDFYNNYRTSFSVVEA
jgi:hypothetical protein